MSEPQKKYYWLKLSESFFDDLKIKRLRQLAGGDTLTVIYLKLQLKALRNDGVLRFRGIDTSVYDELALDIDESADNVQILISYLMRVGLAEVYGDDKIFLPDVIDRTGKEGSSAPRMRALRARMAMEEQAKMLESGMEENPQASQCDNNVRTS